MALGIGLLLTPMVRELARRAGMIDAPDPRRVNKEPIPRGGGLAVFFAFHITVLIMIALSGAREVVHTHYYPAFLAGSSVLAFIGLLDDAFNLRPFLKLMGQLAVALFLSFKGLQVNLPFAWAHIPVVQHTITVIWMVGIINAFNLIDGLDGLASGLAIIASIGMIGSLFFGGNFSGIIPFLIFCGALLAFLRYNFNPASVFLGDTGSMFIGLTLAVIPLANNTADSLVVSIGVPILCVGIPILDTALAILRRSVRALLGHFYPDGSGDHIMRADRDHIHHRFLARYGNQRSAVSLLYTIAIGLVAVGYACVSLREKASGVFLLAFLAFSFIIVRYMTNIEIWDTGRLISESRNTTFKRTITLPIYLLCDLTSFAVCWLVTCYICYINPLDSLSIKLFPAFAAPLFISLFFLKHYARSWSQARQRDEIIIPLAVILGFAVSHTVLYFMLQEVSRTYRPAHLCFSLLCIIPLWLSRVMRASVLQTTSLIENYRLLNAESPEIERTLIYGAGYHMHSYVNAYVYNLGCNRECIIGVIDDNPNLKGAYVCDSPVFGTLSDFTPLLPRHRPTRILICAHLTPDRQVELARFALTYHIPLFIWESSKTPLDSRTLLENAQKTLEESELT